jgi:hypothetical protein
MHWSKVVIRSRQTMHWPNEKGQEDKQWSKKHYTYN